MTMYYTFKYYYKLIIPPATEYLVSGMLALFGVRIVTVHLLFKCKVPVTLPQTIPNSLI